MQNLSEHSIVRQVPEQAARRLTRRAIVATQRMTEHLGAGDTSGLKSVWEEICVQVQFQESVMWETYVETVKTLLRGDLEDLAPYEREALWLPTPEGDDWDCEEAGDREPYPVLDEDIVEHLWNTFVQPAADRWSNPRIRAHLDRAMATD